MSKQNENAEKMTNGFPLPQDFCPIVHFHTSEMFFPCSYDFWAANKDNDVDVDAGFEESLSDAPIYWQCVENENFYYMQYVFFYAASGDLGLLGLHYSHMPHVSNVIVVVDKHTMAVVGASLSGTWSERKNLVLEKGSQRPHVYVAYLNHRNYPDSGIHPYGICCLADYTSTDGREWKTKELIQFNSSGRSVKVDDLKNTT